MAGQHNYSIVTDWQQLDSETAEAICAFWLREKALLKGEEPVRRAQQVVAHVLDQHGEIAAVATVTPKLLPRLGQPLYYYRCFIGKAWRSGRLVRPLLRHAQGVLDEYAREHDFPCIGMLLELENKGFATNMQWAHWHTTGFSYIGKSSRGLDLRVYYFRGAHLKSPEQVKALVEEHRRNAA